MPSAPDVLTPEPPAAPAPAPAVPRFRVYDALRHAAANPFVRAAYFSVVALAALWPMLGDANRINMYQDSQQHSLFEEAARLAVMRFHEWPLWDPYYCGGLYGLGTPSARYAAPPFALTLLFGTLRGAALTHLLMTLIGLEGTYRYVRARGGGSLPAMLAAPVFALSGVFAHATLVAWTNFFGFELAPWALLGVRRALDGSRRGLALASLSMGWMVGFGGTYTAPLTAVAVAFEVACIVLARARRPHPVDRMGRIALMGLLVVILSAGMSMVRLWPIAETLSASPRLLGGKPGAAPAWLSRHLFGEKTNHWGKGEFYLGLPVIPLVLFGIWRRRSVAPVIGAALWIWFSTGYKVPLSIFAALRTIPPYTMLRAPERFLVFLALAVATVAALGIRRVEVAMRRRRSWMAAAVVLYGLLLGDTYMLVKLGLLRANTRKMEPAPPVVERDFRQDRGNRWVASYYPWMSRGSLTCFDDYDVAQSPRLRGDLPAEEYLNDVDAGTVKRVRWSPDRIDLQVDLVRPARVYVNQNWHPGWRSNAGEVVSDDGLLSLDLPEGSHAVTLRFEPRSAIGGAGATAIALAVAAWLVWRARRQRDQVTGWREAAGTAALSVAPFLAVGASFATMREPSRPPPLLLTPAGESMVVDQLPEDTTPLGARWDEGIVLEGTLIDVEPGDDSHGPSVTVELDWRFDKPLPPGLGFFIQFERQGQHFATDHVLLSGVVVPEAAPLDVILRDVSDTIALPDTKTGSTWKAWGGVWRARRDGTRLTVVDPGADLGAGGHSTDRVFLGSFSVAAPHPVPVAPAPPE